MFVLTFVGFLVLLKIQMVLFHQSLTPVAYIILGAGIKTQQEISLSAHYTEKQICFTEQLMPCPEAFIGGQLRVYVQLQIVTQELVQ